MGWSIIWSTLIVGFEGSKGKKRMKDGLKEGRGGGEDVAVAVVAPCSR